ncbi:MAG: alpha/beta hydrolase [Comamonadaceae bacterium]|nr:MAG: alpha/beta hydrolase [Comamonadaceae bacterium]
MTPPVQVVHIDGVDVFIEGEGLQTLVMIHGWPDTHHLWDSTVTYLLGAFPKDLRIVRFTLPGYDMARPPRRLGMQAMTDFFAAVVDTVSPHEPVTLVLHDWGCVFGYEYMARHPSRVSRLVGVDIGDHNSGALRRSLSFRQKLGVAGYQIWLAAAWKIGKSFSASLGNRMACYMARGMRWRVDPLRMGWQMGYPYVEQWTGGGMGPTARVAPVCPMLYLYGRRKPFQFQSQEWLDRISARPGCEVKGFDTGHWIMQREPAAFNEAIGAWLARTPAGQAQV